MLGDAEQGEELRRDIRYQGHLQRDDYREGWNLLIRIRDFLSFTAAV